MHVRNSQIPALIVAISLVILTPASSFAQPPGGGSPQRPQCAFDSDGFPTNPGPGACFVELGPLVVASIFNPDGLVAWFMDSNNRFSRLMPKGRTFFHAPDQSVDMAYCPLEVYLAGQCFLGSPTVFYGTGHVVANGYTQPGGNGLSCPFTVHSNALATRPSDDATAHIRTEVVIVPAPRGGCRAVHNSHTLTPTN